MKLPRKFPRTRVTGRLAAVTGPAPAFALLCLCPAFGISGCDPDSPRQLTLEQLSQQQSHYDGRLVTTSGILRRFEPPLHYWLEDDSLNRVALDTDNPRDDWVGRKIAVTGRFGYGAQTGRRIEVSRISLQSSRQSPAREGAVRQARLH